jgi:hypothetical protein
MIVNILFGFKIHKYILIIFIDHNLFSIPAALTELPTAFSEV